MSMRGRRGSASGRQHLATTDIARSRRLAGVFSPGHAPQGWPRNRRELAISSHTRRTASGKGSRGTCNQGSTGGSTEGCGSSLTTHSTGEGGNRRARAVTLAVVPAGENPVGGDYPVATVVIPGSGKGDRTAESPEVKVSKGEASNSAGRSNGEPISPEIVPSLGVPNRSEPSVKASAVVKELGICSDRLPGDSEDDMLGGNGQRKRRTTRGSPRRSRTAKASHIRRSATKLRCACE